MVEREECREKRNYRILKIADPLQSLMLREDTFFMWEGWGIFTKLLGCLVTRQKFNCNNMFSFPCWIPGGWEVKPQRLTPLIKPFLLLAGAVALSVIPRCGGNNNNFPASISGLVPQKAPAGTAVMEKRCREQPFPRLSGSSQWKLSETSALSLFHLQPSFLISSC